MADINDYRNDAFRWLTHLIVKSEKTEIEPAGDGPRYTFTFRTGERSKLVQEIRVPMTRIELAEPEEDPAGDEIPFHEVDWQSFCDQLSKLDEERQRVE
jgi:hypothetical protein